MCWIATEGLTPCESNYTSVLGNYNFRTRPTPQQPFCLASSAPTPPSSSCSIKNIYFLFVLLFCSEYILVIYFLYVLNQC